MENQIQDSIDIMTESSNITPKKISNRYDKETGKYDKRPLDPEYYEMYWRCKNEHIPCEHCGKSVAKLRMCKHIKSQKCQKSQKVNQLLQLEDSLFQALEILEKTSRNFKNLL